MNKSKFIGTVFVLSFLLILIFHLFGEPFTMNELSNVFILAILNTIIATFLAFMKIKLFPKK